MKRSGCVHLFLLTIILFDVLTSSFCNFSWFAIVKHLGWTLLGIADVEPFTSSDSLSNYIAQVLYAGFIISALILLVNMMIAVLSSTYERVEVWTFLFPLVE